MKLLAAFFWLLCAAATIDWVMTGNDTAPNGIIGGGICAVVCTALVVVERR